MAPLTEKQIKDKVHRLAYARLKELERLIEQQYGMKCGSGIELEFYYRTPAGGMPEEGIDTHKHQRASALKIDGAQGFKGSPYIEKFEKEIGSHKYEVTLGNLTREATGQKKYTYRPPHVIARAAIATQKLIQRRTEELYPGKAFFWPIDRARRESTAGMHVNLSLWKEGKSALTGNKKLVKSLTEGGLAAQDALLLLVLDSPDSLRRFQRGNRVPHDISFSKNSKRGSSLRYLGPSLIYGTVFNKNSRRFESRIAGADADPVLAMLMAVGGMYLGLGNYERHHGVEQGEEVPAHHPMPTSMEAAYQRFSTSDAARQILGDELHSAVLHLRNTQISVASRA